MTSPVEYRFLIQLVDAKTEEDARREIFAMYGQKCLDSALFAPGCQRRIDWTNVGEGVNFANSLSGFTVYVPEEYRHP